MLSSKGANCHQIATFTINAICIAKKKEQKIVTAELIVAMQVPIISLKKSF